MGMYTEHLIKDIQINHLDVIESVEKMLLNLSMQTMDYHCIDVNLQGDCCIRLEINKSKKPLLSPNTKVTKEEIEQSMRDWIEMERRNDNPLIFSQEPFDCSHNCQFCTIDFCQERSNE